MTSLLIGFGVLGIALVAFWLYSYISFWSLDIPQIYEKIRRHRQAYFRLSQSERNSITGQIHISLITKYERRIEALQKNIR